MKQKGSLKGMKSIWVGIVAVGVLVAVAACWHARAQALSILRPIADGSMRSGKWVNSEGQPCNSASCFSELNDLSGGEYCDGLSDGDVSYIESSTPGATETFVIDTSHIPNGTVINGFKAVICGRKLAADATSFQTVLCVNGSCHNANESISPDMYYSSAVQTYSNINIIKDENTKIELGYKFTGPQGKKVRVSWVSGEYSKGGKKAPTPTPSTGPHGGRYEGPEKGLQERGGVEVIEHAPEN